jgi:hypothetical protein
VVCITPRGQQHFEKNQRPNSSNKSGSTCKSLTAAKSKLDYVDSKDSGHETSSIHTENSENSSTTSSGQTPSPTLHKSFHQPVRKFFVFLKRKSSLRIDISEIPWTCLIKLFTVVIYLSNVPL